MPLLRQVILAALAGVAQAASLAWPGNGQPLWWLQIVSLAALAVMLGGTLRPGRGAALAWVFASAWLCGSFWWLFTSLHTYGGLAAPLAVLAVVGLAVFLAAYYAAAGALFVRFRPASRMGGGALFAGLWLLAELARNTLWTGFPWGAGGYAHTSGPLVPLARLVGAYGVGYVAAWLAMLLSTVRLRDLRSLRSWAVLMVVATVLSGAGWWRTQALRDVGTQTAPLTLALLQGNISQDEKFQAGTGVPAALQWYAEQLLTAKADLVVAPETAVPLLPAQLPAGYLASIAQHFAGSSQAALIGIPLGDAVKGYTNSVLGFAPDLKPQYRYDKHHLVPFGEFVPPLFRWFINMLDIPLGDFSRGGLGQASFHWRGERIAPNICYEDLFGDEIAAHFREPSSAPTVLLNLSNIAWFGDGLAIDQHLQISRMRALEFERPMVRATNTGATAVIDDRAALVAMLPRATRGVLNAQVQGRSGTITPFAWWASRWRLAPLWWLGALCLLAAVWARSRVSKRGA